MLAVIPVRDGVLPAGGAETAAECGGRAALVGSGARAAAAEVVGDVFAVEAGAFRAGAWAEALVRSIRRPDSPLHDPILVLPASPDGRDLAPRLAAALSVPLLAGAVSVSATSVVLARDGGTSMHTVAPPMSFVATLQPGVRGVDGRLDVTTAIVDVDLDLDLDLDEGGPDGSHGPRCDAEVLGVLPPDAATIDLAEAPRILGGGAGLAGARQFEILAELGLALSASVGATRVITDRGWIAHERQIGTTGVVVEPDLYVAFGVSGAVQHTSGLGQPDHIISVNTDPHCPMMQLADLAIVADANAVLDELRALLVPAAVGAIGAVGAIAVGAGVAGDASDG